MTALTDTEKTTIRQVASEMYGCDDLEIDSDAQVNEDCDNGHWVAAWVWVAKDNLKGKT